MQKRLEELAKIVFKRWRRAHLKEEAHPDEEELACFLEHRLSVEDGERIQAHLLLCQRCAELMATQIKLSQVQLQDVPQELVNHAKDLVKVLEKASLLEIFLSLKERAIEIIGTSGDVLVGQELVPAPVLRSRKIKDFKDEVTILKDFPDVRVEARIVGRAGKAFDLTIAIRDKKTQSLIKDLRITLLRDDTELESYVADAGSVTFEHVAVGRYTVNISTLQERVASILVDIKL